MTTDEGVEFFGADDDYMKTQKQWCAGAVLVAALVFMLQTPLTIEAQDAPSSADTQDTQKDAQNPDQDPPSRVARLNYIDGSVSFQPDGASEWVDAVLNRPLAAGDNLWADDNSRAEVHIGSTALRLGPKTGITLLEVSDRDAQIRLVQGSLFIHVHHVDDDDAYEIDTPNVAFVPTQPGDYRMDVDADGQQTAVTVWHGRGEVTGEETSYPVVAGQYATFAGSDQTGYKAVPDNDGLDTWALERDRREDDSDASNYVSRDMTGYEDLDSYGDWSYVAAYGYVWSPRGVVPGWAPYRYGNWTWVAPYGWTWVASEPWGFAPFHYGRWATVNNTWMWVPGPNVLRPVYAPAVVGWVGGKFSSGPGVGWVPLAPGEVFVPGYNVSRSYVNRVNMTNTAVTENRVTNVYNTVVVNHNAGASEITYANRSTSGGVTVVSRDTFLNGRPVARSMVSVPTKELASAPVSSTIAIEPAKASVIGAAKAAAIQPPASITTRTVVALRTPAPTPHSPNQTQQLPTRQLVRQQPPAQPLQPRHEMTSQSEDRFRSLGEAGSSEGPMKSQPRVWEAEGTPERQPSPARANSPAGNRNATSRQQSPRPTVKPASAVQTSQPQRQQPEEYSSWHQQRTTTPSASTQTQHPTGSQSSHPAAATSSSTSAAPAKK
jgi:hypothetical protein